MKGLMNVAMAIFLLAIPLSVRAEYLIYLKGGHYIVADNCTFSIQKEIGKEAEYETERDIVLVEDCANTKEKPEGPIFWSTIDGKFGEVNADDVYTIFGSKNLASIGPTRKTQPFEDYLITVRGESFVNAKSIRKEEDSRVYGLKRDDLANVYRRGVIEIVPEADAISRSGEGLCAGERAEFDVSNTRLSRNKFVGSFKNLSRGACMEADFEVEITDGGNFIDKFPVKVPGAIAPSGTKWFSAPIPDGLKGYVEEMFANPKSGIQICYTKVQSRSECEGETRQQIKP